MEWLAGAIGAVVGGVVSLAATLRKSSGKVAVTDADRLWDEARAQRTSLELRIFELETDILRLRRENHELRGELTRIQLLATPNIPEEVRERIIEQQSRHLRDLEDALDRKRAHRPVVVGEELRHEQAH